MLESLSIANIVLIEKLDIDFKRGLSTLTGETGAGKSILLDSLGLALGARGDAGLVRQDSEVGQVVANFDLPTDHPIFKLLDENAIEHDFDLLLKRVQNKNGKSKAFINDQSCSTRLLKQVGDQLIEIHGQHDNRALADSSQYILLLDAFGGLTAARKKVTQKWQAWKAAENKLAEHIEAIEKAQKDEDYTRHVLEELESLSPASDEEQRLAEERSILQASEKVAQDIDYALKILHKDGGVDKRINNAMVALEKNDKAIEDLVRPSVEALDRALVELQEANEQINILRDQLEFDPMKLNDVEERLFSLRAAARKHGVMVDDLPELLDKFRAMIANLEGDREISDALYKAVETTKQDYVDHSQKLSEKRQKAAKQMSKNVCSELPPLKLENAIFYCDVNPLDLDQSGPNGMDQVAFEVMTNPGTEKGPLMKVASGGELARIMLSLKVTLAAKMSAPTLVFDEIDTGVGGAVAEAIGDRLSRLGQELQVLTVTHSPQVAAKADQQFKIEKNIGKDDKMVTHIEILDDAARHEEIARMLAGAVVTDEARAAASILLD